MATNTLVQTRIDADIKERAARVLDDMGLTVSDVVRILLTRTANEGVLPLELIVDQVTYDNWFQGKIRDALNDERPDVPHDEVKTRFAMKRAQALSKRNGE
jgi:DNA-damage-inducible protein J